MTVSKLLRRMSKKSGIAARTRFQLGSAGFRGGPRGIPERPGEDSRQCRYGRLLPMAVELEAVEHGVCVIPADRVFGHAHIPDCRLLK